MSDILKHLAGFEKSQNELGDRYGAEILHNAAKEIERLHDLHLDRTKLTDKALKDVERLTAEGASARSIICDWYEMWECSNDPKRGLIRRTEEYLDSASGRPTPKSKSQERRFAHQMPDDSSPKPVWPEGATLCDSCSEPAVIKIDGISHCLCCGASADSRHERSQNDDDRS